MAEDAFKDAALILVAHGSSVNQESCQAALQHREALSRLGLFALVTEAFVQQEPALEEALVRVEAPRVFVVPFFVSEGWFTEQIVPARLGLRESEASTFSRVQSLAGRIVHYCRPVGSHPAMTGVLRARAREVVASHPFPRAPQEREIALFIAGHGTPNSGGSRASIEEQVERFRREGEYAEVHGVFLEEQPGIAECWDIARVPNLVLVPFFLSDGLHTQEDIPVLLGESESAVRERLRSGLPPWRNPTERRGRRLWYARPVGTEPLMADVILERVREAAGWAVGPPGS